MSTRIEGYSAGATSDGSVTRPSPARLISTWFARLVVALAVGLPTHFAVSAETTMVMLPPETLQWGDPILPGSQIPAFEKGAKVAVLQGVPGESGPVVVRLKFPANFAISPHWHSTDEVITVLSGTLHAGMGDRLEREKSLAFPIGAFIVMPAKHHHFAWTQEETVVEIHANNPFDINYINPSDDPRRR
jgi:uncharacterized RmlC-like cupin family protein